MFWYGRQLLASLALLVLLLSALPVAYSASKTVLVLGDSLSAEYGIRRGTGWVALFEQRVATQAAPPAIVNASVSGETTIGGRNRLPALLAKHRPDIVVIELGANDALRGLPLSAMRDNLRAMVRAAKESGARPLLVGMQIPPNYGKEYADRFAASFETLAKEENIPLVPFLLKGIAENPAMFQSDRLHPNEEAQQTIFQNVWPVLEGLLRRS